MNDFVNDHAAGLHQAEIVGLMEKIEPCLHGHSRALVILTLIRLMAVMLGPAKPEARETYLRQIPMTLRNILREMDRMMARKSQ